MNRGFTQSLTMATLGRNMQLDLKVTTFFTVKNKVVLDCVPINP